MTGILAERRALMMQQAAPEPIPYITDGLIFWLDGLDATASEWVDKVGGVVFSLTDCVKSSYGVDFNGSTSGGAATGAIPGIVTVGAAITTAAGVTGVTAIFDQPSTRSNPQGILWRGDPTWYITTRDYAYLPAPARTSVEMLCASIPGFYAGDASSWGIKNGAKITTRARNRLAERTGSGMTIGKSLSDSSRFHGTIHSLWFYNRALTEDEMQQNQAIDNVRYNLGVIS